MTIEAMPHDLQSDEEPVDDAFKAELEGRVEALWSGKTKTIAHHEAMNGLKSLINDNTTP